MALVYGACEQPSERTGGVEMDSFQTESGLVVPAVTAEQMREVDRVAIEEVGPNLYQMMENAGRSLASLCVEMLGEAWATSPVVVLAGTGGNGAAGSVPLGTWRTTGARSPWRSRTPRVWRAYRPSSSRCTGPLMVACRGPGAGDHRIRADGGCRAGLQPLGRSARGRIGPDRVDVAE